MDIKNLEEGYEQLCRDLPEYNISRVHGKMKAAEKEAEMQDFISGKTQILVATTVIEVGVNVPNASVMVIENAERFGAGRSCTSYVDGWGVEPTSPIAFWSPNTSFRQIPASVFKS